MTTEQRLIVSEDTDIAIRAAEYVVASSGSYSLITRRDIFLGLLQDPEVDYILRGIGVDIERTARFVAGSLRQPFLEDLRHAVSNNHPTPRQLYWRANSPAVLSAMEIAQQIARQEKARQIRPPHLLLALVEMDSDFDGFLDVLDITGEKIIKELQFMSTQMGRGKRGIERF